MATRGARLAMSPGLRFISQPRSHSNAQLNRMIINRAGEGKYMLHSRERHSNAAIKLWGFTCSKSSFLIQPGSLQSEVDSKNNTRLSGVMLFYV